MTTSTAQTASCLCGAIHLTATPKSLHVDACHCDMCRKWGGGPFLAVECEEDVQLAGNSEALGVYSSSDWAERGFCRECGTHLFYRLKEGGHYVLPAGLFDGERPWTLASQVFIDRKPDFYDFSQKTRNLTGDELFALFGADT